MAAESDTDTDQKGRAFTANDIVQRDDYKCQQCGYVGDESEKMYAHYLDGDHTDPSNYECQCAGCVEEDDKSMSFKERTDRWARYFAMFPLAVLLTVMYYIPYGLLYNVLFHPERYGGNLLAASVLILLALVVTPIYVQLLIWLEPRNGIVYRLWTCGWSRTGSKAIARIKQGVFN